MGEEEIIRRVGVSVEEVKQAIGKKRNWSGAGRDKIRNYWWKKFTVVHEQIAEAYENITNDARGIDIEWLVMGETELIGLMLDDVLLISFTSTPHIQNAKCVPIGQDIEKNTSMKCGKSVQKLHGSEAWW